MHWWSGELGFSPPEYRYEAHILIHIWIDIHCGAQTFVCAHSLATGESVCAGAAHKEYRAEIRCLMRDGVEGPEEEE